MSVPTKSSQLGQREVDTFAIRLLTIVAACTVIFVGPFAVYRFIEGSHVIAAIDFLLILIACASAYYARLNESARIPGVITSVALALGAAILSLELGIYGAVWLFPVMMFSYYFCRHWEALLLISSVLATIGAAELINTGSIFASSVQIVVFFGAAAAATVLSNVFASQNLWQQRRLMQWATLDPLTGLENRRSLEHELNVAAAEARRHGLRHGLLIIDIDGFKKLNDAYGHFPCDRVLVDFASLLRSCTRIEDRIFRYGGDEFVIILPNPEAAGMHRVAQTILDGVPEFFANRPFRVTASIGGGSLQPGEDVDEWKERVDRCLYEAKDQGRSRYISDGFSCL